MDGDRKAELSLDSFSLLLPLPYRIAIILVLGVWAWALNLHAFFLARIDIASLIKYPNRGAAGSAPYHLRVYRLAILLTLPLGLSLILFWIITHKESALVLRWELLPQSYLFLLALIFVVPYQRVSKAGRYRFLSTLKRISIGGIAEAPHGKFGDILLADALTSYAKVLGDLYVSICMLISQKYSSTAKPDRSCGGVWVVPFVISIPSIIRLRQCLTEYGRAKKSVRSIGASTDAGWGGQHLANALKYSSALPVTMLSALQRSRTPLGLEVSEAALFRLWVVSVLVNSLYSFYWDVSKDWDLTLFSDSRQRNNPEHAWALRQGTYFRDARIYYAAIIVDFFLRCTWSLKLSPHLDHFNDLEAGIFVIELLEVFRRWIWIFLRVETEWVRTSRSAASEELLLEPYRSRLDLGEDNWTES